MARIQGLVEHSIAALKFLAAQIPRQCYLCSQIATPINKNRPTALCTTCLELVTSSISSNLPRCSRCALILPQAYTACLLQSGHQVTLCFNCQAQPVTYNQVIAAFDYQPPSDMLIYRFKVQRQFRMAPGLAGLLEQAVCNSSYLLPCNLVVVPVPASRQAILRRGFNPAAELAKPLSKNLGLSYRPELLRRVRDGQKQAHLNREQRMISTAHIYGVYGCVKGMHIAVVDDVFTTGATLYNIARLFLRAGAASVCGIVLARTPI